MRQPSKYLAKQSSALYCCKPGASIYIAYISGITTIAMKNLEQLSQYKHNTVTMATFGVIAILRTKT